MSQYDFGIIDPYVMVGVELADALNQWRDAMYSLQRGSPRPTFIVPGQLWINDSAGPTNWQLMWYVSPTVGDVPLFSLNTVTGAVTISAAQGGTFNAAVLLAQAAATPSVQWNASGNPIDVKNWRMTVNGVGALVLSCFNDAGVLQQSFTFNRDGSFSQSAPTGWRLLQSQDVVAATTVDFLPAVIPSTTRSLQVLFDWIPSSPAQNMWLNFIVGGVVDLGSNYSFGSIITGSGGGAPVTWGSSGVTGIPLGNNSVLIDNGAGAGIAGQIIVPDIIHVTRTKAQFQATYITPASVVTLSGGGNRSLNGPINGLRLYFGSSTGTGHFDLLGRG